MESILTMLKPKKISVLQEFILKFISAGIDEISAICKFLGVHLSSVNKEVAILQKNGLISVDIYYAKLKLTRNGEEVLKEAVTIVPEDVEYVLYVDGLLGNIYLDTRKLYTRKELHSFDIRPVNADVDEPTLEDLVFEDVRRAVNIFKKNHAYEKDKLEGDLKRSRLP